MFFWSEMYRHNIKTIYTSFHGPYTCELGHTHTHTHTSYIYTSRTHTHHTYIYTSHSHTHCSTHMYAHAYTHTHHTYTQCAHTHTHTHTHHTHTHSQCTHTHTHTHTYSMSSRDHSLQCTFSPDVHISTQCARIGHAIRTKCQAQHGLNLSCFAKDPFLWRQSIAAQWPKLDVLDTTWHKCVFFEGMELDVKHLCGKTKFICTSCVIKQICYLPIALIIHHI